MCDKLFGYPDSDFGLSRCFQVSRRNCTYPSTMEPPSTYFPESILNQLRTMTQQRTAKPNPFPKLSDIVLPARLSPVETMLLGLSAGLSNKKVSGADSKRVDNGTEFPMSS